MTMTADLPVVHSLSGLPYRPEQATADAIVCRCCGDPLPDTNPGIIEHDADGYAWHDTCWVEAGMHLRDDDGTHPFVRSTAAAWKCGTCGASRQSKAHGWVRPKERGPASRRPAGHKVDGERVTTADLQPGDRVVTTMGVAFDFGIPIVRAHTGRAKDGEPIVRTVRSTIHEAGGVVVRFDTNDAKSEPVRAASRWVRG